MGTGGESTGFSTYDTATDYRAENKIIGKTQIQTTAEVNI